MAMKKRRWVQLGFASILGLSLGACGSGSSTSTTSTTVSDSFPADLALASPTTVTVAEGSISKFLMSGLQPGLSEVAGKDYLTKKAELSAMLSGTVVTDCAFTFSLTTNTTNAACYGPTLTYENHPDVEDGGKDADTVDDDGVGPNDTDGDGSLPSGDLGIWRSLQDDSTIPCSAGQLNAKVDGISTQVDSAEYAMASMICLANVNGIALPSVGETTDLTSVVSSGFETNAVELTVSSASLARDADDADGNTVYIANLVGTTTDGDGDPQTVTVRLKHIPTATDNSTYKGKLSYTVATDDGTKPGNCTPGTATGQTDAVSISYEKDSETSLTYQLNSGNFCGNDADPYVSATNFTVDSTKSFDTLDEPNGWANNFSVGLFNLDPSDGTGNFQFAWQAGAGDSNTRVMNAAIVAGDGSTVSGSAYFGFGPTAQEGAGAIDRMICNWAGAGSTHTGQLLAQRQTFDLDTSTGTFSNVVDNITYAPTNSCDSDGTDGASHAFAYTDDASNTVSGTVVANDLVDVTEVGTTVTAPTAPTEIDL